MVTVLRQSDKRAAKSAKSKLPSFTMNMWAEAVRELAHTKEEPIPDGYLLLEQVCTVLGVGRTRAFITIKQLEAAGKLDKRRVMRVGPKGRLRATAVYKIIKK